MSETPTVLCPGSDGPAGDSFPGFNGRRECPACGDMLTPREGTTDVTPRHIPPSDVELAEVDRMKANMLFIVFRRGMTWARIAPMVTAELAEAREAALRDGAEIAGVTKAQVAALAVNGIPSALPEAS